MFHITSKQNKRKILMLPTNADKIFYDSFSSNTFERKSFPFFYASGLKFSEVALDVITRTDGKKNPKPHNSVSHLKKCHPQENKIEHI